MVLEISALDTSVLIALGGAAILYFGKVIGDVKVENYDKLSYYIEGLFFAGIYVFLPYVISLYVINSLFMVPLLLSLVLQILTFGILSWTVSLHNLFKVADLSEHFGLKLNKKLKELRKGRGITRWASLKQGWFKSRFGMDYLELNLLAFDKLLKIFYGKKLLFMLSVVTLTSLFSIINTSNMIALSASLILTLLILTLLAIMYSAGSAYYPQAKVYLSDGKVFEGRIIKFGEYIYLINKNEKLFLNKSHVKLVKENLFKNQAVK